MSSSIRFSPKRIPIANSPLHQHDVDSISRSHQLPLLPPTSLSLPLPLERRVHLADRRHIDPLALQLPDRQDLRSGCLLPGVLRNISRRLLGDALLAGDARLAEAATGDSHAVLL